MCFYRAYRHWKRERKMRKIRRRRAEREKLEIALSHRSVGHSLDYYKRISDIMNE